MLLDDAAAEREAEAGAAEGAGVGGVALLESVEDSLELFGGDAAALIFNAECNLGHRRMGWAARRMVVSDLRKLDGVFDQFVEHLQDALLVGQDLARVQLRRGG